MKIVVLEDDTASVAELLRMIQAIDTSLQVVQVLHNVADALSWFASQPMPDLIISDIYLPDGKSFDVFRGLAEFPPVIFCTAYDQHALEAFENNGIDYLLKPLSARQLQSSFEKIRRIGDTLGTADRSRFRSRLHSAISDLQQVYRKSLIVYEKNNILVVPVNDILYMESRGNKVAVHTAGREYELYLTLEQVLPELNPEYFYRANRQVILNRRAVQQIETLPFRKLSVVVGGSKPAAIVISKEKKSAFLSWMEGLPAGDNEARDHA